MMTRRQESQKNAEAIARKAAESFMSSLPEPQKDAFSIKVHGGGVYAYEVGVHFYWGGNKLGLMEIWWDEGKPQGQTFCSNVHLLPSTFHGREKQRALFQMIQLFEQICETVGEQK